MIILSHPGTSYMCLQKAMVMTFISHRKTGYPLLKDQDAWRRNVPIGAVSSSGIDTGCWHLLQQWKRKTRGVKCKYLSGTEMFLFLLVALASSPFLILKMSIMRTERILIWGATKQQQKLSKKLPTKWAQEEIIWVCEFILAGISSCEEFALSQDTVQKVLL